MSYDRQAPTVSSKAKKLFDSGNMGQNNWGTGTVPLSDGLDTHPCEILDPRLLFVFLPCFLDGVDSAYGTFAGTAAARRCL